MAKEVFILGVEIPTKPAVDGLKNIQQELEKTSKAAKDVGKGFGESVDKINGSLRGLGGNLKGLSGQDGFGGVVDSVSGLTRGMGLVAGAAVGVTAAVGATTFALIANASAMADAADNAAELADMYGISTTKLAAYELIAKENGTTVGGLISVYDKLANSLDDVSNGNIKTENAFRKLGIQQGDLAGKSQQEIAGIVIKNYEALGRTVQATAAVQDILGRSFREQIPAIRAAANEYGEYEKRIAGSVATKALEEAGARQEKALSDLGLAFKSLRISLAGTFTNIVTDMAVWATDVVKYFDIAQRRSDKWQKEFGIPTPKAIQELGNRALDLGVPKSDIQQIVDKAKNDNPQSFLDSLNPKGTSASSVQYYRDVYKALKPLVDLKESELDVENRRLINLGKPVPLPVKDKPVIEKERLTESQRDIQRFRDTMLSSFSDLDKQLAISALGSDKLAVGVTELAFKLYDAGKGVISFADALKVAQTQSGKLAEIQSQKVKESLNLTLSSLSQEIEYLRLGNKEREVRLALDRAAASAGYKSTSAFEKAQPLAAGEIRSQVTSKFLTGVDIAGEKQIASLREQVALLSIVDEKERERVRTRQELYRSIDPDGAGENITRAQKAELDQLSATIARQQELIEINRQVSDSFANLGDAVTRNMLRMSDSSKALKLELVKLLALTAMRYYAGTGNTLAQSFFGGLAGARAEGGPIDANKSYLIGEKGPEIVKFNQSGYVIPNNQIGASRNRTTVLTLSPNLIIQGGVTGQSELDRAFEQFASAMANETQKFFIDQSALQVTRG